MEAIVYDALSFGRKNAIRAEALAKLLGFRSKRELQKQIERERNHGFVILTDFSGGGYFKSNDAEDMRRFTRVMNAKAKNTLRALESAERALNDITGQDCLW